MQNISPVNSCLHFTGLPALKNYWRQVKVLTVFSFLQNSIFFFALLFTFSSCTSTKSIVYFQNLQKDTTLRNLVSKNYEPKIQNNDLLSITVAGMSPDIAFYNILQATNGAAGSGSGYPVDENGNIQFVKLGSLHVEGMTKKELKALIEKDLVPYLKDVFVTVNFLNRHVTMLGAITPQILPMPGDNMTILEALATSGGVNEKGRIDNVLVIREKDDSKTFKRLTLADNSIFYSPYFYLQPNDIIYVEPVKNKAKLPIAQIISYVTTGLSLLILIFTQFIKL